MNHKIQQDLQQQTEQYKDLLDLSTEHLQPSIKARLDDGRRQALDDSEKISFLKTIFRQPAMALVIPLFILAVVFLQPKTEVSSPPEHDIYADLQLLEEEDQLEFLAELNVSEWLVIENEG